MSFGDAFDAHDLARTYERLMMERAIRTEGAPCPAPFPRAHWPALPNDLTAHAQRRWLDTLTVGDAEFLHAVGIDPLR